jgi:protein SCO1/2
MIKDLRRKKRKYTCVFSGAGALLLGLTALAAAKSYPVDGVVIAVDPAARTMLVSHRAIGKYMPAMMMPFRVEDGAELKGLYPGVRVQFDLEIGKDRSIARHVRRSGEPDAEVPSPKGRLQVGGALPDFRLTDQQGAEVRGVDLRGKVVAVDFIYTRCPLPDVCPRLSANFAALQRRFAGRMGKDLVLLSVTVDPDYDTPAVLSAYAKRWGAGNGWRFLTGDVSTLAGALGEVYWTDEGSIGHNSMTSVIGRDGRLAAVVEGASYRVDQLEHLVESVLEGK